MLDRRHAAIAAAVAAAAGRWGWLIEVERKRLLISKCAAQ